MFEISDGHHCCNQKVQRRQRKPALSMVSMQGKSERVAIGIAHWRGSATGVVLLRVEVANLFAVVVVETIDEFTEEVVDHDGGGVIEHRQMERECNGIGF